MTYRSHWDRYQADPKGLFGLGFLEVAFPETDTLG